MKLNEMGKSINYSMSMLGIVMALTNSTGYAGTMGPAVVAEPGKAYVGVFGGAGTSTKTNIAQYGTAFFTEAQGGPLAVDAFGRTNSRTVGLVGAQVGYQWMEILANPGGAQWGLVPAVELEGYYLGKSSYTSHEISNDTTRLPEHDFLNTYPTKTGVFLANAVLNLNTSASTRFHPYLGAGIGAAVLSISNADSTQVAPPEAGVNHYNSNPSATDATFAGQAKVGLNYDITHRVSLFAEYRWLYVASTDYTFGSTVFPGHAPTSSWLVKMDSQNYNLGAVGIRFSA